MSHQLSFTLADWNKADDGAIVVSLLQAYALHPMGGGSALSDYAASHLPEAMAATPGAFSVIGWLTSDDAEPRAVALANCFTALSTFACKPLINIHDLYVGDEARGQGTGQAMLGFVEQQARERGCCKVTLEVLAGNVQALAAYQRFGFEAYSLDDTSGHAIFMHKTIVP